MAVMLRALGYDAVAAAEVGAGGESDQEQFERARSDGRAILSFNRRHFYQIAARCFDEGIPHSGIIIVVHQHSRPTFGQFVQQLVEFLDGTTPEALADNCVVLA